MRNMPTRSIASAAFRSSRSNPTCVAARGRWRRRGSCLIRRTGRDDTGPPLVVAAGGPAEVGASGRKLGGHRAARLGAPADLPCIRIGIYRSVDLPTIRRDGSPHTVHTRCGHIARIGRVRSLQGPGGVVGTAVSLSGTSHQSRGGRQRRSPCPSSPSASGLAPWPGPQACARSRSACGRRRGRSTACPTARDHHVRRTWPELVAQRTHRRVRAAPTGCAPSTGRRVTRCRWRGRP